MSQQLADDIRTMRDYIDEHGWTQGTAQAADGSVCLVGASFVAIPLRECDHSILPAKNARNFLREQIRMRGESIPLEIGILPYFNDRILKSKEEALEFLDKAAIAAEEKA